MGNNKSVAAKDHKRTQSGSETSPGLLQLADLVVKDYPFENLIFEGNGIRAFAYAGAIKVLEKIGLLRKIKRFSGVGTGAVVATMLAVGFDCDSMQDSLNQNLDNLSDDQSGYLSLLPNLINHFGWNPGNKFYDWFGELLDEKCGGPDITFWQLYRKTGKELCIVVTNINKMCEEYCHPKTTPDMPIRVAIRMTLALPVIFYPTKYGIDELQSYYCNGGIVCNYPIHSFDGWWLSMKPEDVFYKKLQLLKSWNISNREIFSDQNANSLGFILFDEYQSNGHWDIMKQRLDKTEAKTEIPDTVLGRKYRKALQKVEDKVKEYAIFTQACEKLTTMMDKIKDGDAITEESLTEILINKDCTMTTEERMVLFDTTMMTEADCIAFIKTILEEDKLTYTGMVKFIEKKGWQLKEQHLSYNLTEVNDLHSFLGATANTLQNNSKRVVMENCTRTIGIYSGHVTSNDSELDEADQMYLYQQGWNSTVAFLREIAETALVPDDSSLVSNGTQTANDARV